MTVDDLLALVQQSPDHDWEYHGRVFLPLAARDVPLLLICDIDQEPSTVTPGMADALAALVSIDPGQWPALASILAQEAKQACETSDYGFSAEGDEDTTRTNYRMFGLTPEGRAPEGWAEKDWIDRIEVEDLGGEAEASLAFKVAWEQEHGVHVRLENGAFEAFNL